MHQWIFSLGTKWQWTFSKVKDVKQHFSFLLFTHHSSPHQTEHVVHLFIYICLLFVSDPACFSNERILKGNSLPRSLLCATVPPGLMQKSHNSSVPLRHKVAATYPLTPPLLYLCTCLCTGHHPQTRHFCTVVYSLFMMKKMFPTCNITDINTNKYSYYF